MNYDATVSRKRVVNGRSTTYELKLNPWGPRHDGSTVSVSPAIFKVIQPGDIVTLQVRRGALGVRWYQVFAFHKRDT